MAVDRSYIGRSLGKKKLVIERGPVSAFAKSVKDESPVYQNVEAARRAGFADIPAPPTYGFSAIGFWGTFPELQPKNTPPPGNPIAEVFGPLSAKGGIVLHGEEEFIYHRPIVVGDVLLGEGRVVDLYEKESKGRTMTFMVTENVYRDEKTGEPVLTTRFNLIHRSG